MLLLLVPDDSCTLQAQALVNKVFESGAYGPKEMQVCLPTPGLEVSLLAVKLARRQLVPHTLSMTF